MAYKLGLFRHQQQVIDAVQELEKEGFTKRELQVFVKGSEHSRRIEAETGVDADELNEMTDMRGDGGIVVVPAGIASGSGPAAGGFTGTAFGDRAAGIVAGDIWGDGSAMGEALRWLGLDDDDAKECRNAIAEGWLVLMVETSEDRSDGGPDLGPAGPAEAVFRRCGAERILG
ncbi:general stress protein [Paenibacillus spongiae]|uniref:General stress protein n=1 Tax=Paenibacillus spongiae TaxID=2909671 RepID=A0ABY5SEN2_9BACL|nr:general stress protein [Paenibacillus spongiae]UVI31143.1 general stress protein [Paenibacillus spongiae]